MQKHAILAVPFAMAAFAPLATLSARPNSPERPAAFGVCAGCHSVESGKSSFGPNLSGVFGRKAGSLPGYAYSDALKSSGYTWNAKTLDEWLRSPRKAVPGSKMPFNGYADPATRRQVIQYLEELN